MVDAEPCFHTMKAAMGWTNNLSIELDCRTKTRVKVRDTAVIYTRRGHQKREKLEPVSVHVSGTLTGGTGAHTSSKGPWA